jgi:outer membrane protein assembly factor BamD (BamD/ComL family)
MKNLMKKMGSRLGNGRWWIGLGLLLGMLMACGEDPRQLFETARFEEQQHNRAHAQELYEQIIQQHPDSEFAEKARQRLEAWKAESPEGGK